jgi:hypothetical protein
MIEITHIFYINGNKATEPIPFEKAIQKEELPALRTDLAREYEKENGKDEGSIKVAFIRREKK